jgi:hypothetical protein
MVDLNHNKLLIQIITNGPTLVRFLEYGSFSPYYKQIIQQIIQTFVDIKQNKLCHKS